MSKNSKKALTVEHIDLRFGGVQVLNDVTLDFQPGHITGLIGPNGAGKTSFFNCLSGHYRPSKGEIKLGSEVMTNVPTDGRSKRGIVRTFQHAALSNEMTLIENVMVGLNADRRSGWIDAILPMPGFLSDRSSARDQAMTALDSVGLAAYANLRTSEAAPGLLRLVEIARACIGSPRVLLLDEPAAGLNPSETVELSKMIMNLRSPDRMIIVVEHDMDLIMEICDRIHVLNFGTVVTSGTPLEIQKDKRVAEVYLGGGDE